ncbi:MAG TPA: hypothetical protein VGZ33_01255 [Acidimicrobiales bacterium]|nr:hypothetical protein [Acidimicrobiales bacterium]
MVDDAVVLEEEVVVAGPCVGPLPAQADKVSAATNPAPSAPAFTIVESTT